MLLNIIYIQTRNIVSGVRFETARQRVQAGRFHG